jgi:hypothetical protein
MRSFFAVAALPLLIAATPAQAEVAWQGEVVIASVTAGCGTSWQVGNFARAVFRPANDGNTITTNDADAYFSIFTLRSAFAHKVVGGQFVLGGTGDPYVGAGISSRGKSFNFQGGTYRSLVAVPSTITAATPTIRISGSITKFSNVPGCTIAFRANLVRRSDL